MERKRRGPDGADWMEPRHAVTTPRRPSSMVDAVLELQATAGNRSVAAALDRASVQRQPTAGRKNDGGALTLDSGEAIPLQSATWSIKQGVKALSSGSQRHPDLVPTRKEAGDLLVTRSPDAHSARLMDLLGATRERGSLRLDRPSRDGALPATNLTMTEVTLAAVGRSRGDEPTETLRIAVGDLQVAGMGQEASDARAVAHLQVSVGADAWPPIPVISWRRDRPTPGVRVAKGSGLAVEDLPPHFNVKIAAGMGLTRLAEALDRHQQLELTLSLRGVSPQMQFSRALVVRVSSSDGPNLVEVEFAPEDARTSGSGTGSGGGTPSRTTPPGR